MDASWSGCSSSESIYPSQADGPVQDDATWAVDHWSFGEDAIGIAAPTAAMVVDWPDFDAAMGVVLPASEKPQVQSENWLAFQASKEPAVPPPADPFDDWIGFPPGPCTTGPPPRGSDVWSGSEQVAPPGRAYSPSFSNIPMSTPSKLRTRHSLGLRRSLADTEHESEEEDDYDETEDEDWFTLGIDNDTKRHSLRMEMLKGIPASRADLALLLKRVYNKLESQSMEVRDIADNNDEDEENLGPKRRSPEVLRFQADVRLHTKLLLKVDQIDPVTDLPYEVPIASAEEINLFIDSKKKKGGPTLERFALDLTATRSRWNKQLACIFADSFISTERYGCGPEEYERVFAAFVTHLSTLRLRLIEANQAGDEEHDQKKLDEQKEQAQEMRRRNLRGWRLAACKQVRKHHGMEECLRILDAIPLNVHSGDESAHVGGTNKYQVLHQRWRNPSLRLFFKFLDWLHLAHRFGGTHRAGRGAFPRWRVRSQKVDPADAPPGLPKNFYCPSYLASLDEGDLKLLKVQPPVELAIPAEIFRLAARYRRVTSRKDGKKIIAPNDPILPPRGQDFYPLATTI